MAFVNLESYKLTGVQVNEHELGTGSFSTVIELEYMGLRCAGKKIHDEVLKRRGSDYDKATHSLSKECHLLSGINHPNIVQFLGVFFQLNVVIPILVMEFLPTDLTSCINRHGILPDNICYSILHDIAQGLLYLHSKTPPIIHRDLSSNNILLTPILTAKIADLGMARILNLSPLQISTMTPNPGTTIYMPPEVMVAKPRYDTSIDNFSFGILMIRVLSGQSPQPEIGQTRKESGRLIAVSEAERRKKLLQVIGDDHSLMELILKCIDNDPQLRPPANVIVHHLETKVPVDPPSFKQRSEIFKYIEDRETERRKESRNNEIQFRRNVGREMKQKKSTYIWIVVAAVITVFAYNAGIQIERRDLEAKTIPTKMYYPAEMKQRAQNVVNITFQECTAKEAIKCDKFVPTVIRDLGHISWTGSKDLQTTMYQGQTVVIDDKVYYGGSIADIEEHKYTVYCYDTKQDNWTSLKPLPVRSFGLGKFNGKLIAIGGMTKENKENFEVYTFDEISLSWNTLMIPSIQTSWTFPGVLSLPSALVVTGGQSIQVYTQKTGWYWSDQPLPIFCSIVTLTIAGNICYALGVNFLGWTIYSPPLSLYVPIENILWDRNKTAPGMAYEYRDKMIYPSYRWKELPGGTPVFSLEATVLAGNLITIGKYGQQYDNVVRMYSLTNESWSSIGQLPDQVGDATITALSPTELLVTGKKQDGVLSVYRGSIKLFE